MSRAKFIPKPHRGRPEPSRGRCRSPGTTPPTGLATGHRSFSGGLASLQCRTLLWSFQNGSYRSRVRHDYFHNRSGTPRGPDTAVGGLLGLRWGARGPTGGHAWGVDCAIADVPAGHSARWRLWPGTLAASAVSCVRAPRLWRAVWLAVVLLLTVGAVVFGRVHRDVFPPAALTFAVLATAPLLFVRRWPVVLAVVVGANAVFVVYARLVWPPTAVVAWLLALALCPLMLRRPLALALLVGSEVAVLAAAVVPAAVNPRPWDAPITEALAVLLVWGAGETVRSRRQSQAHRVAAALELRAARGTGGGGAEPGRNRARAARRGSSPRFPDRGPGRDGALPTQGPVTGRQSDADRHRGTGADCS